MNEKMIRKQIIQVLVVQQWEKCKGELRAMIALQGSYFSEYDGNKAVINNTWRELQDLTEKFIKEVEDNGLNE